MIQGDEAALSSHCKRQQVYVRDLVVPQDTAPIDACFGSERYLIGPKLVIKIGTNLLKLVLDALESRWPQSAVAGQIENADDSIFNKGAGRNFDRTPLCKCESLRVVNVSLIQKCYPDVNVKKMAQIRFSQVFGNQRRWRC